MLGAITKQQELIDSKDLITLYMLFSKKKIYFLLNSNICSSYPSFVKSLL